MLARRANPLVLQSVKNHAQTMLKNHVVPRKSPVLLTVKKLAVLTRSLVPQIVKNHVVRSRRLALQIVRKNAVLRKSLVPQTVRKSAVAKKLRLKYL